MAFPDNDPNPRLEELGAKWQALGDINKLKGLTTDDYAMIGDLIVLYGYIDLNLRRLAEAFDNANILSPKWGGKTGKLFQMGEVSEAVQSAAVWGQTDENLKKLRMIEEHRKLRNLFAHCAVRRFPEDDAFLFMFTSKRDFERHFGIEPPPGMAIFAINECADVKARVKDIEWFQSWLARVTSKFIEHLQPVPIQQVKA